MPKTLLLYVLFLLMRLVFAPEFSTYAFAQGQQDLVDPIHISESVLQGKEIKLLIEVREPPKDRIWQIDSIVFHFSDQFGMDSRKIYPIRSKGKMSFSETVTNFPLQYWLIDDLPDGGSIEPELCYHLDIRNSTLKNYFGLNYLLPGWGNYRQNSSPQDLYRSAGIYGMLIAGFLVQSRAVSQYNSFAYPADPSGWDQRHDAFQKARNAQQLAISIGVITATIYLHHQYKFFKSLRSSRL